MAKASLKTIAYEAQDNWHKVQYNCRYLDALASIFGFIHPCAAIIYNYDSEAFLLSYNVSAIPLVHAKVEEVRDIIESGNAEMLLLRQLLFNTEFQKQLTDRTSDKAIEVSTRFAIQKFNLMLRLNKLKLEEKFYSKGKAITKVQEEDLEPTLKCYRSIITDHVTKAHNHALFETFIRPLQDVHKALNFLREHDIKLNNIRILQNEDNHHAEINLIIKAKDQKIENINYEGISKLSCAMCHETLEIWKVPHRGTHGLCFDGWREKLDFLPDAIRRQIMGKLCSESLSISEDFDQRRMSQHRKISIDTDYEKDEFLACVKESYNSSISDLPHLITASAQHCLPAPHEEGKPAILTDDMQSASLQVTTLGEGLS